jgi:hypothetical protein
VTSNGTVYETSGGDFGLGAASVPIGVQGAVGVGFVEAPYGPKPAPTVIDAFVNGWTYNAAAGFTAGPIGLSETIVANRDPLAGGEEYFILLQDPGASISLTSGTSCSFKLGNVKDPPLVSLAALVPSQNGPWPWQDINSMPNLTVEMIAAVLEIETPIQLLSACLTGPPDSGTAPLSH